METSILLLCLSAEELRADSGHFQEELSQNKNNNKADSVEILTDGTISEAFYL